MTAQSKMKLALRKILSSKGNIEIPAFLGDLSGVVKTGRPNRVYVTLFNGDVITVVNQKVPNVLHLPVIIGKRAGENMLQILRSRDVYLDSDYIDLVDHALNHEWGKLDTLWVWKEQFTPGLPLPAGGLTVKIFGTEYYLNGWHAMPTQIIDMTSEAVTVGAVYVLVEIDDAGVITFNTGTPVASREVLEYSDIPEPAPNKKQLFAVKMYAGQTEILKIREPYNTDIIDLRWAGYASGGGSGLPIEDTYANFEVMRAAGTLTPNSMIIVTDRCDLGMQLTVADDPTVINAAGIAGWLNCDFQGVGSYTGVLALTGIAKGTVQGVWYAGLEAGITEGDIVFWNLTHYQLTDDAAMDGTNPATNTAAYTVLPRATAGMGYITEYDPIGYDWAHDWLQYREDKKGNKYRFDYKTGNDIFEVANSIPLFQWGNDVAYSNNIENSLVDTSTMNGGEFANNTIGNLVNFSNNTFGVGCIISSNTIKCLVFTSNTLAASATIAYNYFYVTGTFRGNTINSAFGANIVAKPILSQVISVIAYTDYIYGDTSIGTTDTDARLLVVAEDDKPVAIFRADAGQTDNIFEAQQSDKTVVTSIDKDGKLTAPNLSGGTSGQLVKWSGTNALVDAAIIPPAVNILTITNAAASTLALNITAGKILTLTAADSYTLTIPASLTVAGLAIANVFTNLQTITATNIVTGLQLTHNFIDNAAQNFTLNATSTYTPAALVTTGSRLLNFVGLINGSGGANASANFEGIVSDIRLAQTSGTWTTAIGNRVILRQNLDGPITTLVGFDSSLVTSALGTGAITAYIGLRANSPSLLGTATVTNAYGFRASNQGNAKMTNSFAYYIDAQSGSATQSYGIYQAGAGYNVFQDIIDQYGSSNRQQLVVRGFSTQTLGTAIVEFLRTDAAAGVAAMLKLTTVGSLANGDGGSILLNGKSSTTANTAMGMIDYRWIDVTHATRKSSMRFYSYDTAARLGLEIEASGTAAKLGFFGAGTIVQPVNTVAINDVLVNLGLRATGGSSNFSTDIVGASADTYWTGSGSGLPYGGIYGENVAYDLVLAAQDTDYQIVGFATAASSNLTTVSVANSDITVAKTGIYLVGWNAACHSHAANDYSIYIKVNNGATGKVNTKAHFDSNVGDKILHVGNSAIIALTAADTVELWAHRNDGGAVSKTLTFDHLNMHVTMIGG